MKKTLLLLSFISINAFSIELDLGIDIDLPPVCENLPSETLPVNLSAICLSAQLAAQTFPPLLPAANQLCQTLEGITAQVEVIQIQVNTAHDICDSAIAQIETDVLKGLNNYHLTNSSILSLIERLSKVNSAEDLFYESVTKNGNYIGIEDTEWQENILFKNDEEVKTKTGINFYKKVAGSNYLAKSILQNNAQNGNIESIQNQISQTVTLKQSQDLSARMAAELSFQQNVFNQLLGEYLELESAKSLNEISQERWYHNLLKKRSN